MNIGCGYPYERFDDNSLRFVTGKKALPIEIIHYD